MALAELARQKRKASIVLEEKFQQALRMKSELEEAERVAREKERNAAFERAKEKRIEDIRRAQDQMQDISRTENERKPLRDIVEEATLKKLSKAEKRQLLEAEKEKFLERKVALEMKRIHDWKRKAAQVKKDREVAERIAKAKEEAAALGVLEPLKKPHFSLAAAGLLSEGKGYAEEENDAEARDVSTDAKPEPEKGENDGPEGTTALPDNTSNVLPQKEEKNSPDDHIAAPTKSRRSTINDDVRENSESAKDRPAPMEQTESQKSLEYRKTQDRLKAIDDGTLKPTALSKKDMSDAAKSAPEEKPKKKGGCIVM